MNTYIVLFRGINVGGKNLLPMQELVTILEENKYKNIRTYIQSGNVVLQSQARPDKKIRLLVLHTFGFEPEVMALDETEFHAAVKNNPYTSADGKAVHFYFCKSQPKINTEKLTRFRAKSEQYQITGKVFYLHAPEGIGRSKLVANIEACLGVPATGRNLNTVKKLQLLVQNT